jgi:hypothetical protein
VRGEPVKGEDRERPTVDRSQDEVFISLLSESSLCPWGSDLLRNDRDMTESIFEPTAGHLICLALRGGQISVVDEGKDKKSKSDSLPVLCYFSAHTRVGPTTTKAVPRWRGA